MAIDDEGLNQILDNVAENPPEIYIYSDGAYMFIVHKKCNIVFQGGVGVFRPGDNEFCHAKNTISLTEALRDLVHDTTVVIRYKNAETKKVSTPYGITKVRYVYHMFAYTYTHGDYIFVFATVERIEYGLPKIKNNEPRYQVNINDRVYKPQI